ncbi:MAG: hypothetical protein ACPGUD_05425 [Parashewanella sp.]
MMRLFLLLFSLYSLDVYAATILKNNFSIAPKVSTIEPCRLYGVGHNLLDKIQTQTQVDNFKNKYKGCTDFDGVLVISDTSFLPHLAHSTLTPTNNKQSDPITNLSGLSQIKKITTIFIQSTALTSLIGLESLNEIKGFLVIKDNPNLVNLDELKNLQSIYELRIIDNDSLSSLVGLDNLQNLTYLYIKNNAVLRKLEGLSNITSDPMNQHIILKNNPSLTDCQDICHLSTNNLVTLNGNNGLCKQSLEKCSNIAN